MNSLYKITDVYATTTRGEGFGLPIVESLNYNNPVVAPTIGGHVDFLDKKSNLFIESSLEPVDGFDNSLWSSYKGNWVEASVNSTRKNLRKCYNLPKQEIAFYEHQNFQNLSLSSLLSQSASLLQVLLPFHL